MAKSYLTETDPPRQLATKLTRLDNYYMFERRLASEPVDLRYMLPPHSVHLADAEGRGRITKIVLLRDVYGVFRVTTEVLPEDPVPTMGFAKAIIRWYPSSVDPDDELKPEVI